MAEIRIAKSARPGPLSRAANGSLEVHEPRQIGAEFDLTTIVAGGLLAGMDSGFLREIVSGVRAAALRHKLFLSVREAAEYTGLPISLIRRLIASEQLPAIKARGWRIKRNYLDALELRHIRKLQPPA